MTSARTTMRRGAGLLAFLSALLLTLTFLLIPPASAQDPQTPTCKDVAGYEEVGNLEEGVTEEWGSTEFTQDDGPLILTVNEGYTVMLCLKKGTDPIDSGPYTGPLEDVEVNYPGAGEDGFSHYSWRLVEDEPEEADVTLVKRWQDADGQPADAPEAVEWEATLTLDDGADTTLTVSDTAGDTDSTTTEDGTGYTVAEDDSSEDFDEVACSEAVLGEVASTYSDADTFADGTGAGAVDGDTVHVVCNTVPETEEITWDLTVEKDVVGDADDITSFSFLVECGDDISETLTIADGASDSVTDIPEDTACTVTETTELPEDAVVTITTSEDATVVEEDTIALAARSTAITVSFVNTFEEDTPTPTVDVDDEETVRPTPQDDEPDDVEVLPNVVEKPAPTPPTVAAADELPRTGLSSTQLLLLSLLLMGLGAVMILGPEGRRES